MRFRQLLFFYILIFHSVLYGESIPLFRISIENTESHVQTQAVQMFVDILKEKTAGELDIEFYHSASLFRNQDVIRALSMDKVEMAVPGTWQFDEFIPEVSYFLFPEFFGENEDKNYNFIQSSLGQSLIATIEQRLDVKIPGLLMDLGHAHLFTTDKKINNYSDLQGLKIRVAGGIVNKRRVETLGASGVIIPWPDLPNHLRRKSIDGLLTSFETVNSARLWELGVRYVFMDKEYFPQYIPIISKTFWNKIPTDLQLTIIETWNEAASIQRIKAKKAQIEAQIIAEKNGMIVVIPQEEDLKQAKQKLLDSQNSLIDELRLNDFISKK